jgi:hypothetical protein
VIVRHHDYAMPTFIVCGAPFTGSSLVAGTLRIMGVNMGTTFTHPGTHQDSCFTVERTAREMRGTIRERYEQTPLWGFKSVNCRSFIEQILPWIRQPVFILCSRALGDIASNSRSPYRPSLSRLVSDHLAEEGFWCNYLLVHAVPWCIIPYRSDSVLAQLLEFSGLECSEEQYINAQAFNDPLLGYSDIPSTCV